MRISIACASRESEGWTFTVGEDTATKYSLDELCGMKALKNWGADTRFDPCLPTKDLPAACNIRLTTHDLSGRGVRTLLDDSQASGHRSFEWEGTNDRCETVASGIYLYWMEAEPVGGDRLIQASETKKMLLLK